MKNPFKPHIVKFKNDTYGIRRLCIFGWEYLDLSHGTSLVWDEHTRWSETECKDIAEKAITRFQFNKCAGKIV